MGKNTDSGDSLVDYLVRVMFLAVILIVGLAVLGGQVANVLHHVSRPTSRAADRSARRVPFGPS